MFELLCTGIRTLGVQTRQFRHCLAAGILVCALHFPAFAEEDEFEDMESLEAAYTDMYADEVCDPLEPFNRVIYTVNDVLDRLILEPAARFYRVIIPEYGRQRIGNVLQNLGEPIIVINGALQADPDRAFTALWRFIINSTFGLGGLYDAAATQGLEYREEDFGQTLASWGLGEGVYLMLPILGPSNLRDLGGRIGDIAADPFTYILTDEQQLARRISSAIHQREALLAFSDELRTNALDPYLKVRSAYQQRRKSLVENRGARTAPRPTYRRAMDIVRPDRYLPN